MRGALILGSFCFGAVLCSAQEHPHLALEAMGGFDMPVGSSTSNAFTSGYNVLIGGGRNFTPTFSAMMEFEYNRFGLTTSEVKANNEPAGFSRFWSFSLSPRYNFHHTHKLGAFVTGGVGIYGRQINFTDPSQVQTYCDPYYGEGCETSSAPIIGHVNNYGPGFNGGGGITYSPWLNRVKLAADIRYHRFLANSVNSYVTMSVGFVY